MLSSVLPAMTECTPQELLPIMPPRVQRSWVAGSGAKVRWCFSAAARRVSSTTPGCTRAMRREGSDFKNLRHVLGEIQNDSDVAALAGERGATAAAEQRSVELAAEGNGGFDIIGVAGENNADGNLAVVGSVGGVEGAGAGVETNFAANLFTQRFGQGGGVHLGGFGGLGEFREFIWHTG